jgi:hypothetical protein
LFLNIGLIIGTILFNISGGFGMDLKDYSEDLLNFPVNELREALGAIGDSLGTYFLG